MEPVNTATVPLQHSQVHIYAKTEFTYYFAFITISGICIPKFPLKIYTGIIHTILAVLKLQAGIF